MKTKLTRNRVLSVFLSLCMVISMLPTAVFAVETEPTDTTTEQTVLQTAAVHVCESDHTNETDFVCAYSLPVEYDSEPTYTDELPETMMLNASEEGIVTLGSSADITIDPNDVTTWTQAQTVTAGNEGNSITMYYDKRIAEDGTGGAAGASHYCKEGATVNITYEAATTAASGKIIATCDTCNAQTYIVTPQVTMDMFYLDDTSKDMIENGVTFNTTVYTINYLIQDEYQWLFGYDLTNNIAIENVGTYTFAIRLGQDEAGNYLGGPYNAKLEPGHQLVVNPMEILWTKTIQSHIYDGVTGLLASVDNFSFINAKGERQEPKLTIYPVYKSLTTYNLTPDLDNPISDPVDVGYYYVKAEMEVNSNGTYNYRWKIEGDSNTYTGVYAHGWILPGANPIYVNDTLNDVTFTGRDSAYFKFNITEVMLDTTTPGQKDATFRLTFIYQGDESQSINYVTPVTVMPRDVTAVPTITAAGKTGSALTDLLPNTVNVTAETLDGTGKTVTDVPVTWDATTYNASKTGTQTINGTLGIDQVDELGDEGITTITANVTLASTVKDATAPTISDYEKTYNGKSTALPVPTMPTGIDSYEILYQGTTAAGKNYSSTTAPTDAGTYTATVSFTMTVDTTNLIVYNQLDPITVNYVINPYEVTINKTVTDMNYDGTTSVLDHVGNFTYKDVNNATKNADVAVYRVYNAGSGLYSDQSNDLGDATAAGLYNIHISLADTNGNYKLSTSSTTDYYVYIYPTANFVYVNDTINDVTLNGGTSSYFSYAVTDTQLDTSAAGTKKVNVTLYSIYNGNRNELNAVGTNVEIKTRAVTAVPRPTATGNLNASIYDLMPSTVTVTAENLDGTGKSIANVPVTWDLNTYDATYTSLQYVSGTLDIASVPELNDTGITTITGEVTLGAANASIPNTERYEKTYDGKTTEYPTPVLGTGINSVSYKYEGTSALGVAYSGTTAPINAGEYTVTITWNMADGFYQLDNVTEDYIINPAVPTCPYPILVATTDSSLTVEKVNGVKYSIDGGKTWQDSNIFTGLDAYTTYTISQYIPATADGNYTASAIMSNTYSTSRHQPTVPSFDKQTYVYDGTAKNYVLPAATEGIASMTIEGYTSSDGKAPVNVGTYTVNIIVTPADGYNLDVTMYFGTIEITKGSQNPPDITNDDVTVDFTSLSVPTIAGAQYSIDGGTTWQTSGTFTGLTSNMNYIIAARMMETDNLYASDIVTVTATTKNNSAEDNGAYQIPTESQTHTYDATPKAYNTDGIILDNTVITNIRVTSYSGITDAGKYYNSTSAPTNAGTYSVSMVMTPADGYQLNTTTIYGTLVIEPASQTCPVPVSTSITATSITVKAVDAVMYSLDGATWQDSNIFNNLTPSTTYTIYQYVPKTEDANYAASAVTSAQFTTLANTAKVPTFKAQSYVFDGTAKEYVMPALTTGIKSATVTNYGTTDGNAPVNVGTYNITITLELMDTYQLDQLEYTTTLNITKGNQDAPNLTNADVTVTDTTITVKQIDGAEYSINGGNTWQTSGSFTGLNINTTYNVVARMAETDNLYASDTVTLTTATGQTMAVEGIDYKLPIDQTYTYDGTRKALDITGNNLNPTVITTYAIRSYTGTTYAGKEYNSSAAPTEAGEYVVTVRIAAKSGYALDSTGTTAKSVTANLTINKATQTMKVNPVATSVTAATIVIESVKGAEYSIDNQTWQSSTTFTGLNSGSTYTVYQRYAETGNYYVSNTTSASFTTTASSGAIDYEIDYINETISYDDSVVKFFINSSTTIGISDGGTIYPGRNVYAYLIDDGTGSQGVTTPIALPARGAAPDVTFDEDTATVNLDNTMEYSTDSGATWTKATGTLDVSNLIGHAIIVRYAAVEGASFHSEEVEIDLSSSIIDSDGDGIPDDTDPDDDNNGTPDVHDPNHPDYVGPCVDNNDDHICDLCNKTISDCIDEDNDHYCDICGDKLSNCEDTDNDHHCDTCDDKISECIDENNDNKCDICGADMKRDTDGDGIPDETDPDDNNDGILDAHDPDHPEYIGPCVDENNDHKCDICDETTSSCHDDDHDHMCDICDDELTTCVDNNGDDHLCDICEARLSDCSDGDNNHFCDTCGVKISDCIDENNDDYCDICGKNLGIDTDGDGIPDNEDDDDDGDGIPDAIDPDNDYDGDGIPNHDDDDDDGDGIPDLYDPEADPDEDGINNAGDPDDDGDGIPDKQDPDHPEYDQDGDGIPNTKDDDDDGDGILDIHDEDHPDYIGPCVDENNNHICDICDETMSECYDNDDNHHCDVCGDELSECIDDNDDHYCDICGDKLSECIDEDNDNYCDICGGKMDECVDNNNDHYCDNNNCDNKLTDCEDANNDHHCDICGDELSECVDGNQDNFCDICGADMRPDTDGDGIPDEIDTDDDGDSIPDIDDPDHPDYDPDEDGDGLRNSVDDDDDGDGVPDIHEPNHPDYIGPCVDNNDDHICDLCDDTMSDCIDENNDHYCDICGDEMSSCEDTNDDHICDTCGDTLSECKDDNDDHYCDICGNKLSDCIDEDNDDICDICGDDLRTDTDGDGTPDTEDDDDDGDGILDIDDSDHPNYDPDEDGDGLRNSVDDDDNGDGILDIDDPNHPNYDPNVSKKGITITVTNYGPTFASYVEPQGGWITGENKFTVTSSHACAIALIHDGVVTKLEPTYYEGNTYVFTVDVVEYDEIAIVLKGDTDLDGSVTITDMARINQSLVGLYDLSDLQWLAGDTDLDNYITITDMARINQHLVGLYAFPWHK